MPPTTRQYPVAKPASETQIAAMFDRVAARYDFLNALLSARQDRRWRRHLARMVPHRQGGYFLDVATGTGDVLFACARQHPEYAEFMGADISPEMLALAEKKADSELAPGARVSWRQMSATALDLANEVADVITISFGLRNVVDKPKALAEFSRVLKPGGSLLIMEFFEPASNIFSRLFQAYFHHVLPVIGGIFSDRSAYHYLPRSVGSFYKTDELRQALRQAGLSPTEDVSFMFGSCRIFKATKHATLPSTPAV